MSEFKVYLQPTTFFNIENNKLRQKAFELTENGQSNKSKAINLFYFVRDEIKYNMRLFVPKIKNNFIASKILKKGEGFCVSKSILLSSLARIIGIPARIHLVDLINHKVSQKVIDFMGTNVMYYHGFSEFYLGNKWIKLTPSFDKDTAIRGGFLPMVEFDGEHDAVFPPRDIEGNLFGEYVNDRGSHADLPLDEIDKVFSEKYKIYNKYLSGFENIKEEKLI